MAKGRLVVIECLFELSFMSVRLPYAFQVKETAPLPVGTTLYGAIVYALLHRKGIAMRAPDNGESKSIYDYANKIYYDVLRQLSVTCRPHSKTSITRTDLVVRAARYDRKKDPLKEVLESYRHRGTPEGFDAMIKSLVFIKDLVISIAMPEKIRVLDETITPHELIRYVCSIERIGDTESLCCCLRCSIIKNIELAKAHKNSIIEGVNTVTPLRSDNVEFMRVSDGDAVIVLFNDTRRGLLYGGKPSYMLYALPLSSRIARSKGKVITLYRPSSYDLEVLVDEAVVIKYISAIDYNKVTHVYMPSYIRADEHLKRNKHLTLPSRRKVRSRR